MVSDRFKRNIADGGRWVFGGIAAALAFRFSMETSGVDFISSIFGGFVLAGIAIVLGILFFWLDTQSPNPEITLSSESVDEIVDGLAGAAQDNDVVESNNLDTSELQEKNDAG